LRADKDLAILKNEILVEVLHEYPKLATILNNNRTWVEMSENELWQELSLCIFSSNVPYELAQSVFFHLMKEGYLQLEWMTETPDSENLIANELSKPLYLPKRVDGSYRKYRFPNMRARDIYQAAKTVSSEKNWLSKLLAASTSQRETRDLLVVNISGIGLKEASHFLRNIRFSDKLAIIDSHVVSFLEKFEEIPRANAKTITCKIYLELENRLLEICDKNELNLSIFDMAIWHYMRRK